MGAIFRRVYASYPLWQPHSISLNASTSGASGPGNIIEDSPLLRTQLEREKTYRHSSACVGGGDNGCNHERRHYGVAAGGGSVCSHEGKRRGISQRNWMDDRRRYHTCRAQALDERPALRMEPQPHHMVVVDSILWRKKRQQIGSALICTVSEPLATDGNR
jgi:hypothetical protein